MTSHAVFDKNKGQMIEKLFVMYEFTDEK